MNANLQRLLFLLAVCLWTPAVGAAVTVSFIKPESYTDIGRAPEDRSTQLNEIEAHLKQLGVRYLRADQLLKIEVLDVDLAGTLKFSRRAGREVRVMRGGADRPSIELHYVLEAGGRVLADRRESVADMDYLQRPGRHYSGQSLPYEKRMLDDWFRKSFAADMR